MSIASKTAQLVLLSGSRAGMVAPICQGYYLVGRDRECQIRPKTRSVSRTHCLIHFGGKPPQQLQEIILANEGNASPHHTTENFNASSGRFFVLDLNSTSGTLVDGEKTPPRQWVELHAGSELRCGKIAWKLVLSESSTNHGGPALAGHASDAVVTEATDSFEGGVVSEAIEAALGDGGAWQEADVAAFLAAHDDVDREKRYDAIRRNAEQAASDEAGIRSEDKNAFAEDGPDFDSSDSSGEILSAITEIHIGEETTSQPQSESTGPPVTSQERAKKTANDAAETKRKAKRDKERRTEQKRAARVAAGASPLLAKLKAAAAITFAVIALGLAVYQVVQIRSGPPARVIDGID